MSRSSMSTGLIAAVISAVSFSTSGTLVKPLLEAGWSPTAAVTARALTAGFLLLPIAVIALRGRWAALQRARWRILGFGVVGVAATQVAYFGAIQTVPVSTALLVEFLAPLLLVAATAAVTRRMPPPLVLLGSGLAVGGLVLVIGPGALQPVDPIGLTFAFAAAIGCAAYFVIAARPGDDLPPVALAASGLIVGGLLLAGLGAGGLLRFTATFADVPLFGSLVPWWVPLLVVAAIGTALAYAAGITASAALGSRLASFVGLLEVVSASILAWLGLGEQLTPLQFGGGILILAGIAAVRADPRPASDSDDPSEGEPDLRPSRNEAPSAQLAAS